MNKQEDFQNRALALLLTERGVAADFEQRAGRRRMDVVANVEGLRVVLEAETGFDRKAQAIKDADARLRQKLATVVFAVCYPDGVTEDNLAEATLAWTVRVKAGAPPGEWSTGDVTQLAQAVQQAPRSLRICDPACGAGALLMAAAERIRDLRNAAGRGDPEDEEALGLMLVEDVLWGYDVNLIATHMAASTLGMLSPTTRFSRMNIHRALLGVFDAVRPLEDDQTPFARLLRHVHPPRKRRPAKPSMPMTPQSPLSSTVR